MYKWIIIGLLSMLLVGVVLATDSSETVVIAGTSGAFITHSDRTTEASGNDVGFITGGENYNMNAAGTHVVTLGGTYYNETTKSNNKIKNTYNSKNELQYEGGAAMSNSYYMMDNKANIPDLECTAGDIMPTGSSQSADGNYVIEGQNPSYQEVLVEYGGTTADGGRYKTGAVINDANITTSMRAEGNEGMVTANYFSTNEAGFSKDEPTMNFKKQDYSHNAWAAYGTSGYDAKFDFEHKDYSVPFETIDNSTRMSVKGNTTTSTDTGDANLTDVTNTSPEVNITPLI